MAFNINCYVSKRFTEFIPYFWSVLHTSIHINLALLLVKGAVPEIQNLLAFKVLKKYLSTFTALWNWVEIA
jgi:hypothetical protein